MTSKANLESLIKSESHVCRLCGSETKTRWLCDGGYIWRCNCGCTQRVWSCSKDYQQALEKVLAA